MLRPLSHAVSVTNSGIVTVACTEPDVEDFVRTVRHAATGRDYAALLVFFSPAFPAAALAQALLNKVPVPEQIGCSTAGEIGPLGIMDGGAVALLFPAQTFRCVTGLVTEISRHGFERGAACAGALVDRLSHLCDRELEGSSFALTLIDGLSNREEVMVSAFHAGLRNLPHVGGSAGDGLAFRETWIIHNGTAHRDAALLCLFCTNIPFRIFKSDHYQPTDVRFVVTECDAEQRIVTEMNGVTATCEYAEVVGLDRASLSPMSFASHPLVVKIGGDYFCRSIRRVEDKGLSFFCAIDKGVVLTLARSYDMAESVDRTLGMLEKELGGIDIVLGFECVLRRVEAESRQLSHRVADRYRRYNVVGFHTYGEQYKAMHINQTFTGIAFGQPEPGFLTTGGWS